MREVWYIRIELFIVAMVFMTISILLLTGPSIVPHSKLDIITGELIKDADISESGDNIKFSTAFNRFRLCNNNYAYKAINNKNQLKLNLKKGKKVQVAVRKRKNIFNMKISNIFFISIDGVVYSDYLAYKNAVIMEAEGLAGLFYIYLILAIIFLIFIYKGKSPKIFQQKLRKVEFERINLDEINDLNIANYKFEVTKNKIYLLKNGEWRPEIVVDKVKQTIKYKYFRIFDVYTSLSSIDHFGINYRKYTTTVDIKLNNKDNFKLIDLTLSGLLESKSKKENSIKRENEIVNIFNNIIYES